MEEALLGRSFPSWGPSCSTGTSSLVATTDGLHPRIIPGCRQSVVATKDEVPAEQEGPRSSRLRLRLQAQDGVLGRGTPPAPDSFLRGPQGGWTAVHWAVCFPLTGAQVTGESASIGCSCAHRTLQGEWWEKLGVWGVSKPVHGSVHPYDWAYVCGMFA